MVELALATRLPLTELLSWTDEAIATAVEVLNNRGN